ncbi:fatty acid desaturase [Methylopila sp. M107]|uniref:fatty acid desaturase n=1 Tax=Methylopila sp. M107 TaxID=1101190 RepID=UPI000378D846|nr:fatty acid desaturase [Methylopila sp. M107]
MTREPRPVVEWPTAALSLVIYGGWLALTFWHERIPLPVLCAAGAWLVAWQASLQHETMHGHPTRSRRINDAIGWPPLSLWLPYPIYRLTHLRHHRDEHLTDPLEDPESVYFASPAWGRLGRVGRALATFNMTLVGRLTLGPVLMIGGFLLSEARLCLGGDRRRIAIWLRHAVGVALVLGWTYGVCGMAVEVYLFGFVFLGAALTRLRSFAEHRWAEAPEERTAIVERGGLLGLLYLNNNLHVLHHLAPTVPWYRLPALYRAERAALVARNGGLVYRGYADVARRFLFRPHDAALHPAETDR